MPRNSSGTHALPTGQPVISGTMISASTHNALAGDLSAEISASLSRDGKGGMRAPLRTPDGTAGAPSHSFSDETGTGLRRAGAGDLRVGVTGVDVLKLATTGATVPGSVTIETGDIYFTALAAQTIQKTGGILVVGTADDQEVQFKRGGVIGMALSNGAEPYFNSHKLTGVADPTSPGDAATKDYVDARTTIAVASVTAGAMTWARGFSGVTRTGLNGNEYRFAFSTAQADTNYAVFCQGRNPDLYTFEIIKETTQVRIVVTLAGAFDTSAEIDVRVER
jgi:hypothetical protein